MESPIGKHPALYRQHQRSGIPELHAALLFYGKSLASTIACQYITKTYFLYRYEHHNFSTFLSSGLLFVFDQVKKDKMIVRFPYFGFHQNRSQFSISQLLRKLG